jgi:hypothetical protein
LSSAVGGKAFTDTFQDGSHEDDSPVTWSRYAAPLDLGDVTVIDGDLVIVPPASGPLPYPSVPNYWETDVVVENQLYHDVNVVAQVRALNDEPSVVGISVLDTFYNDLSNGENLVFALALIDNSRYLTLHYFKGETAFRLAIQEPTMISHRDEDLNFRLVVSGDKVRATAWPSGSVEPAPQLAGVLPELFDNLAGRVALIAGGQSAEAPVAFRAVTVIPGLPGDFDGNDVLGAPDIDELTRQSASGANLAAFDLNSDALVNDGDINVWVKDLFHSWIGDADVNGEFNSSDLVAVLASGTYEVDIPAVWSTGDFSGDGRSNSTDLVAALADGGYELGPRAAVASVPEPSSAILLAIASCLFISCRAARGCAGT